MFVQWYVCWWSNLPIPKDILNILNKISLLPDFQLPTPLSSPFYTSSVGILGHFAFYFITFLNIKILEQPNSLLLCINILLQFYCKIFKYMYFRYLCSSDICHLVLNIKNTTLSIQVILEVSSLIIISSF